MNHVQAGVAEIFRRQNLVERDSYYGTSKDGIPYALITTRKDSGAMSVVFFGFSNLTVWIVGCVKKNNDECSRREYDVHSENTLIRSQGFSILSKCSSFVRKCINELDEGINTCIFNPKDLDPSRPMMMFFSKTELPSGAVKKPDTYLKPGYLILTSFVLDNLHAGIYIGNGKVVHVSGHREGKAASVARIGNLNGDFANPDGKLWIFDCAFRFRSLDKIVEVAKKYAEDGFRGGEYNLLGKNCQHFASLCAFGIEYSFDANIGDEVWRQMWVTANCEIGY